MKQRIYVLLMLCAALCIGSCRNSTSDWLERVPIFRVIGPGSGDVDDFSIDGRAQTATFNVLSTGSWSVEVSDALFSVSPSSGGSGQTSVSLVCPSNETGSTREVTISFTSGSTVISAVMRQEEQQPYIEITPTSLSVQGDGDDVTVSIDTNQSQWAYDLGEAASWISEKSRSDASLVLSVSENNSGRKRTADIRFYSVQSPELMVYLELTQTVPAEAPVADLLDIRFNADGTAEDVSPMKMSVDNTRLNSEVSVTYLEKYGRYAAVFSNSSIARSSLTAGYYLIPYTTDSDFANKLADGYSYELLFRCYYDPTGLAQVKPFASTQAGGTGMCFKNKDGQINFETYVGSGWKELYSGIIPVKDSYYHVVATWSKTEGIAILYVNGQKTVSLNASGEFKFMTTNVDKRWFGIGADPNASDLGEASFYGEVVIARLYDAPVSAEEVNALYKLVK